MTHDEENEKNIQAYQELALAIAIEIGGTWEPTRRFKNEYKKWDWEHSEQVIQLANRRKLILKFNDTPNRVKVYGELPKYTDNQPIQAAWQENPVITCSMERDPAAIARDIERRLMPGFHAAYSLAEERAALDLANVQWVRETAADLLTQGFMRSSHEGWQQPEEIKKDSARLYSKHKGIRQIEIRGTHRTMSFEIQVRQSLNVDEAVEQIEEIDAILS